MAISKLNVVFAPQNIESVDTVIENALLTQLMVTITRVGMKVDKIDAKIGKENEHGTEKD